MLFDIIEKYSDIVSKCSVEKFQISGNSYQLVCRLEIVNNTTLYIRDYLFQNEGRKYSFHWQDQNDKCIIRRDNAPHHQDVDTFPQSLDLRIDLDATEDDGGL